jgi:hypothetical protein
LITALILLNLILIIFVVRFAIKNVLANFKESKSKFKNIGLILLVVSTFILSITVEYAAIRVEQRISYLENELSMNKDIVIIGNGGTKSYNGEDIKVQLDLEKGKVANLSMYTILGFLFYLWLLLLYKSITNESNKYKRGLT